jgi:two-component system response regulator YesN
MYQILIVDDHRHQVESMALSVPWRECGIEAVHKAFSSDEALELLHAYPIDIVITDIRMPGMSGLDLIAEIRKTWKNVKCIVMSGYDDFHYAKEAIVNKAVDYLLKPVEEAQLIHAVRTAADAIQAEWAEITSHRRVVTMLREHLPLLRAELLNDLLQGRRLSAKLLSEKLAMYEVPFAEGDTFTAMLIRMEQQFYECDYNSLSLFQYAICNIAEEILREQFELWHCKDSFEYLVFFIKSKEGRLSDQADRLEAAAKQIQHSVRTYLKGKISFLIGRMGTFPADIGEIYHACLSAFRKYIGDDQELSIRLGHSAQSAPAPIRSIRSLYEPPTLNHLLEVGRWEGIEQKLKHIFEELQDIDPELLRENLFEVFFAIAGSLSYIAHKNGDRLADLFGEDFDMMFGQGFFRSLQQFKDWAFGMVNLIKSKMHNETKDARATVVKQVQEFIESHLDQDVSLQAIADHVYLNPTYLSKIYKIQTGEGLSDYLHRIRMEKAAFHLRYSTDKIYEISNRLGFNNPNYFIKIFKKHYDMTPQEFREKTNRG